MSFENTAGLGVSNHYGPRNQKGTLGVQTTQDGRKIYSIDVEGPYTLENEVILPVGAVVENIDTTQTAAVTTLLAGAQSIAAAVWGTPVVITDTDGNLNGTFTGKGRVLITVLSAAVAK